MITLLLPTEGGKGSGGCRLWTQALKKVGASLVFPVAQKGRGLIRVLWWGDARGRPSSDFQGGKAWAVLAFIR